MIYRFAEEKDIKKISRLRMAYMREAYEVFTEEEINTAFHNNISYLKQELGSTCFIVFAEEEGKAVSCVYLNKMRRAPNLKLPDGWYAEIYGVFTLEAYRNRGLATDLMKLALDKAKELGLTAVQLEASDMGKGLYERLGFIPDTYGFAPMEYTIK